MNNVKKIFVVVATVACVALAGAQGTGGGQGQGRRGGGGFGQRGQRGGQGSELQLAMRHDVQVDLAVTDDQKTKLQELSDKQRAARGNGGGGRRGGNGGGGNGGGAGTNGGTVDREAMMKAMQEQREQTHKDLAAILNEGQMKRLGEIQVQLQGNRAILNADVQKQLGMTSDQIQKIKDLQTKQQEANQSLRQKMQSQEMTREEAQAAMQKNNTAMNDELGKILTADQTAKLKSIGGKEFKADAQTGG